MFHSLKYIKSTQRNTYTICLELQTGLVSYEGINKEIDEFVNVITKLFIYLIHSS